MNIDPSIRKLLDNETTIHEAQIRALLMLICDDKDVICDYIINVLEKSATYVEARGAYTCLLYTSKHTDCRSNTCCQEHSVP